MLGILLASGRTKITLFHRTALKLLIWMGHVDARRDRTNKRVNQVTCKIEGGNKLRMKLIVLFC